MRIIALPDPHGHTENLAQLATLVEKQVKAAEANGEDVLLVCSGDFGAGTDPLWKESDGKEYLELLARVL